MSSHKANEDFFDKKRPWSERKDRILGYYIKPYLAKISHLRRPVLIVDGFAGRGKFRDGQPGSPLVLLDRVRDARASENAARIECLFIERDAKLADELAGFVGSEAGVTVERAEFLSMLPRIETAAITHSVFLYLDPYTVDGIAWAALDHLFELVDRRRSIEVLLNFNVHSFGRRGRAALAMSDPAGTDDTPESEWEPNEPASFEKLDAVVGGDWWREILKSPDYPRAVEQITVKFLSQLHSRFNHVFRHDVKERERHRVPKYVLLFGSRHPDTRLLMNDAMCESRDLQADIERPQDATLFETRSETLVPDVDRLKQLVLGMLDQPASRADLAARIATEHFCMYSTKQIRAVVKQLVNSGLLSFSSDTGNLKESAILRRT